MSPPTDPFQLAKESHNERLNALAATLQESWDEFLPLSVRYSAAAAADTIVCEYMRKVSQWSIDARKAEDSRHE